VIVVSAYDLLSVGFPLVKDSTEVYSIIKELVELIEVNRNFLVPKVVINVPVLNELGTVSILGAKKRQPPNE
jgi:hypothetical protein